MIREAVFFSMHNPFENFDDDCQTDAGQIELAYTDAIEDFEAGLRFYLKNKKEARKSIRNLCYRSIKKCRSESIKTN